MINRNAQNAHCVDITLPACPREWAWLKILFPLLILKMAESSYTSSPTTSGSQQERPTTEVLGEKLDAFKKFASTSFIRAKQVNY